MANGDRTKWDFFFDMEVTEFLNYMAFYKDKKANEAEQNGRANRI